jgi:hypothetical protein
MCNIKTALAQLASVHATQRWSQTCGCCWTTWYTGAGSNTGSEANEHYCVVSSNHCSLNSAVRPRALPRGVPPRFLRLACRGVHRTLRPAARRHGRGWRTRRRLDARLRAGVVVISYYIFPHYLIRGEFKIF